MQGWSGTLAPPSTCPSSTLHFGVTMSIVEDGWVRVHEKESLRLYGAADPCRSYSFWGHAFASFGTIGQLDAITAQHSNLEARYKTAPNALLWNRSRTERLPPSFSDNVLQGTSSS
jgi:hypothetical protein